MPAPLLVVDAPSLLYRAWFALPDSIRGPDGMPVNALLGATNAILRVVADRGPRAVVICSGAEAARYRVERFAGYHADRPPVPEGLAWQIAQSPRLFEALGWTLAATPDLEADDLLHSFALTEVEAGGSALLMTGDRDMFQCASEDVTVLYLKTGVRGVEAMGPAEVRKRYGVPPELVPDFIALRGDPSDGLPGAKGIGEKTAADLLKRHGSLEAALARPIGETPRVQGALRDQADELRDFLAIATRSAGRATGRPRHRSRARRRRRRGARHAQTRRAPARRRRPVAAVARLRSSAACASTSTRSRRTRSRSTGCSPRS